MARSYQDNDAYVFDLTGDDEGGFYRAPMTNALGQLNRRLMINRGEKFQVMANLLDVVHGTTMATGGTDATLLIASFHFLPSSEKRFAEATITWTFMSDDPAVQIEVAKASPFGSWSLSPVKQTQETNLAGRVSVGPGTGPVTASAGGEYSMKKMRELNFHTTVIGSTRVVAPAVDKTSKRVADTARWTLSENKQAKKGVNAGICRMLQVGVLLERTIRDGRTPRPGPPPKFHGELTIVVQKNGWSQAASDAKKVWKKAEKDDAVDFQPGEDLASGHFAIDKDNLSNVDLEGDVMFMSLHENFSDIVTEREERTKRRREEEEGNPKKAGSGEAGDIGTRIVKPVPIPAFVLYIAASVIVLCVAQYLGKSLYGRS